MIHFECTCGEPFDVPESQGGDSFQCPTCKRLVDVPMLSDLAAINNDGTLKLDAPVQTRQTLVGKMQAFGNRDDMRNDADAILKVGVNPQDLMPDRPTPRYDPETGELVVPIEVRSDPDVDAPDEIPMASAVLGYSNNAVTTTERNQNLKWWSMPWRLLSGLSLMAICFVFIAQALIASLLLVPALNVIVLLPGLAVFIATVAHYCNTIEDFGPNGNDDVPVYLRSVSLSEDVFNPFFNVMVAAVYALAPLFIISLCGLRVTMHHNPWMPMALTGWAGLVFPAILFTAICSGAMQNLMPQRVLSVVIAAPAQYFLATATFWLATVAYFGAFSQVQIAPVTALQNAGGVQIQWAPIFTNLGIVLGLLAVAVYLMHLASAWLGLIYRTHYAKFNWVLQRHERNARNDTTATLLKMHRAQQLPEHSAEAQARLDYIRRADAERRQGPRPVQTAKPAPKPLRKGPRGFEV